MARAETVRIVKRLVSGVGCVKRAWGLPVAVLRRHAVELLRRRGDWLTPSEKAIIRGFIDEDEAMRIEAAGDPTKAPTSAVVRLANRVYIINRRSDDTVSINVRSMRDEVIELFSFGEGHLIHAGCTNEKIAAFCESRLRK